MSKIPNIVPAQSPAFGMPARDAAFSAPACFGAAAAKRVRDFGGIAAGDVVVTIAGTRALVGTTAWRPPSC
jgi:hypothetical protein